MQATIVPARAAVGLRSFATIIVFFIEWVFDILFVTHFIIFEAQNRRFVGITLLFFIGLTYIKILSTSPLSSKLIQTNGLNTKAAPIDDSASFEKVAHIGGAMRSYGGFIWKRALLVIQYCMTCLVGKYGSMARQ